MIEEMTQEYKEGDVVWVKLGPRWWPGEVKDINNLAAEVTSSLKKTPLVVVKFFDEDSYEFVKAWNYIYPYNCDRKNDFIKRGMDAFRAKQAHMEKFPKDVSTAEIRTDGNPNILSDPLFAPEKKTNYSALFFGTPPSKKPKDNSPRKGRPGGKVQGNKKDTTFITHRRWLGYDDYEAHIRIQFPGRDREHSQYSDEEMVDQPREKKEYKCTICKFVTDCLEAIVLHNQSHIKGVYKPVTTSKKPKKSIFKKSKSQKPKGAASSTALDSTDDETETEKTKTKRKRKTQGTSRSAKQQKSEEKPKTSSDIRSDLLAEWDDISDNEDVSQSNMTVETSDMDTTKTLDTTMETSAFDLSQNNVSDFNEADIGKALADNETEKTVADIETEKTLADNKTEKTLGDNETEKTLADNELEKTLTDNETDKTLTDNETEKTSKENDTESPSETVTNNGVSAEGEISQESQKSESSVTDKSSIIKKSCFDFDEEEEESVGTIITASSNGRKIPRVIPFAEKRKSLESDLVPSLSQTTSENEESQLENSGSCIQSSNKDQEKNYESDSSLSLSKNADSSLSCSKNVNEPQEEDDDLNKCEEKIDKNNEKSELESDSQNKNENMDAAFKELLEATSVPEVPDIPSTLKAEQNFHSAKTIKFPDKTESSQPPPTCATKAIETKVATKLTNPKKRFVKSFEDFELLQNEQKRIALEEKKDSEKHKNKYLDVAQNVVTQDAKCEVSSFAAENVSTVLHLPEANVISNPQVPFEGSAVNLPEKNSGLPEIISEPVSDKKTHLSEGLNEGEHVEKSPVKFSKLKTQVMSKLHESKMGEIKTKASPFKSKYAEHKSDDVTYDVLPKVRRLSSSHRTPRSKILETYRNEHLELEAQHSAPSSSHTLPNNTIESLSCSIPLASTGHVLSLIQETPITTVSSLNDDFDADNTSQYCFKKRRFSKLSKALSKAKEDNMKSVESNDFISNDRSTEKSMPELPVTFKTTDTVCAVELTQNESKENILSDETATTSIADIKSADIGNTPSGNDYLTTSTVEKPSSCDTLEQSQIESEVEKVDEKIRGEEEVARFVDQNNLPGTEMETLFSDDSHHLLSGEIRNDIPVEVPNVTSSKPEFSSTSELMMELADGEKSSSADEENSTTEIQPKNLQTSLLTEDLKIEDPQTNDLKNEDIKNEGLKYKDIKNEDLKNEDNFPVIENQTLDKTTPLSQNDTDCSPNDTLKIPVEPVHSVTDIEATSSVTVVDTVVEVEKNESSKKTDVVEEEIISPEIVNLETRITDDEIIIPEIENQEMKESKYTDKSNLMGQSDENTQIIENQMTDEELTKKTITDSESCHSSEMVEYSTVVNLDIKSVINSEDKQNILLDSFESNSEKPITEKHSQDIEAGNDYELKENKVLLDPVESNSEKPISEEHSQDIDASKDYELKDTEVLLHLVESNSENLITEKHSEDIEASKELNYELKENEVSLDPVESNSEKLISEKQSQDVEASKDYEPKENEVLLDTVESITEKPISEKDLQDIEASKDYELKENKESEDDTGQSTPDHNTVHFKYASGKDDTDFDISIKTNLTNLSANDEMSALTTLATVSQLQNNIETNLEKTEEEPQNSVIDHKGDSLSANDSIMALKETESQTKLRDVSESDMVTIDGNLTVVSETDLADAQVEITSTATKNPVTLTNFSLDFSEYSSDSNSFGGYQEIVQSEISKTKCDLSKHDTEVFSATATTPTPVTDAGSSFTKKHDTLKPLPKLAFKIKSKPKIIAKVGAPWEGLCDLEEHIPSQIVCADPTAKLTLEKPTSLEFTESDAAKEQKSFVGTQPAHHVKSAAEMTNLKLVMEGNKVGKVDGKGKTPKLLIKSRTQKQPTLPDQQTKDSKPIILSEKIIKPSADSDTVSVQKITSKRSYQDVEDIDTFIIQKSKKPAPLLETVSSVGITKTSNTPATVKTGGKAKILQQTIITADGEIIQPSLSQTDDNVFDINSMPIVLSDEILTPESIEKMPVILSDSIQNETPIAEKSIPQPLIKKTVPQTPNTVYSKTLPQSNVLQTALTRAIAPTKVTKTVPKTIQNTSGRFLKHSVLSGSKGTKFILLPQSSVPESKTVPVPPKKQSLMKKTSIIGTTLSHNLIPDATGNKIMILTDQQGQKQKVLLTPSHQKLLAQGQRLTTKSIMKGNVLQKSVLASKGGQMMTVPVSTGVRGHSGVLLGTSQIVTAAGPSTATTMQGIKNVKVDPKLGKRLSLNVPRGPVYAQPGKIQGTQKTMIVKNQFGQTLRKLQTTDEALLEKQVAEQLQAIKASGMKTQQKPEILNYKASPKTSVRRSYSKRHSLIETPKSNVFVKSQATTDTSVPPLTPFVPKKEQLLHQQELHTEQKKTTEVPKKTPCAVPPITASVAPTEQPPQRAPSQLVIQDAMGNQTTITEGQILALPSETVDGQPQSYMLVTLDETGNLTPLNSEALMSLDPNLNLGGDLSNMVLQIDQSAVAGNSSELQLQAEIVPAKPEVAVPAKAVVNKTSKGKEDLLLHQQSAPACKSTVTKNTSMKASATVPIEQQVPPETQSLLCTIGGEQQLVVTGDPVGTQKFLESLSDGTTDLANLLSNAEGGTCVVHTDGHEVVISANHENQNLVLSVNVDNANTTESSEGGGNPIFAAQPKKSKDILAAALAGTDVFQQEQSLGQKVQSQLSPNSSLYPINVGNLLEPTLTLSSPIMTPLEVPSTNNKKISDDEADILGHVPKNVDLPITITDPTISQTVSQQHVASLIASELHANLELSLPISESSISVASTEMNSPSFVYTLPAFEDSVEMPHKSFNSSMPLLTEDSEEINPHSKEKSESSSGKEKRSQDKELHLSKSQFELQMGIESSNSLDKTPSVMQSDPSLIEEGLCTLGGEMCTSLSEPPPDMFEFEPVNTSFHKSRKCNIPNTSNNDGANKQSEKLEGSKSRRFGILNERIIDDNRKIKKDKNVHGNEVRPDSTSTEVHMNEDSCEIPILPQIITDQSSEQSVSSSEIKEKNLRSTQ